MSLEALFNIDIYSESMHFALVEFSNVNVSVCELERALTVLFAILEVALVLAAICPLRFTVTLDSSLLELP
jgi:hypothetical protein